jgi:RimJ/RimL family protein N-acetyltransferase
MVPGTVWITDLIVGKNYRKKGIATALVIAAHQWALQRGSRKAVMEMPSKNSAAIKLAQKLGYEFCGYNDQYYVSRDVALFFGRLI